MRAPVLYRAVLAWYLNGARISERNAVLFAAIGAKPEVRVERYVEMAN